MVLALGNKTKSGRVVGMDKVRQVADHVNMVMRYIPGTCRPISCWDSDTDEGPEPLEPTKLFVELAPGAFPGYSLLSALAARRHSTSTCSAQTASCHFRITF